MKSCRPPLFRKRQFDPEIIVTGVRWYLRFSLSLRDVEELLAERGLSVDHTTVWRWVQAYAPEIRKRLQGQVKYKLATWFIDETYIQVAGRWMYLFRAVDNHGQTVDFYLPETRDSEAAKRFLQIALANPDNRPPQVLSIDDIRSYPAAIRKLKAEQTGELHVAGPVLAQSLTDDALIDEYRLYLRPVVLGSGQPFFAGPRPPLHLAAHDVIADDLIRLTYVPG